MEQLKKLHDGLLDNMPEGASHEKESCPLCSLSVACRSDNPEGGAVDKTFTEDELKMAVAEATRALEVQIAELKSSTEKSELDAKIAQAKEPLEVQVKDLQSQLDVAILEAQKHKGEYEALVAKLEAERAEAERKAEIAARREERLTRVREVASFSEAHMEARADAWAEMSDEAFAAVLADFKEAAGSVTSQAASDPAATAMVASRMNNASRSAALEILTFRSRGIDPRSL